MSKSNMEGWLLLVSCMATAAATVFATWLLLFLRRNRATNDAPEQSSTALEETPLIGHDYEVFLNFRGRDTRKNIADIIYEDLKVAGIRTFRDDDELHVGEEIGPNLLKAIENSRMAIPIFSKDYAASKWCLIELAQFVKCKRTKDLKILPVFYDVTTDDVKLKTGLYKKALVQHRKRYGGEVVQEWEAALREVVDLKGFEVQNFESGYQGKFVKALVSTVLKELKLDYLVVADTLVGIHEPVQELMNLLDDFDDDVRIVGIHGMGGIGKTTVAKVVYNELCDRFEYCSFLADVRETSQKEHKGIVCLQNKLLSDILRVKDHQISDVDEGINTIRKRCLSKKVLILIDDVDERIQLEALAGKLDWFGPGSRIIVTTRNEHLLIEHEVVFRYELKVLDGDQSLELFSKHAFRREKPPSEYHVIAKQVAATAGGLPLALEVIGSSLCGKMEAKWMAALRKLEKIPNYDVQKKLRISYDALECECKEMFLDIACLFIGMTKSTPMYLWEDCGLFPENGLEELVLRSLVKIRDNRLWMHDQLRDLGRGIVRHENLDPGRRSRLWSHAEALDVLKRKRGTKKVQALYVNFFGTTSEEDVLSHKEFERLTNLKFLTLNHGDLIGDFDNLLSEVRWLCWNGCPSNLRATNMGLERLVVLDLSRSEMADDWEGWNQIKMMKRLKVLNLTNCRCLGRLPDLSANTGLERLILLGCTSLIQIDSSIRKLKKLVILDLKWCFKLKLLPELDSMVALNELRMDETSIQVIPLSRKLKKLEIFSAKGCRSLTYIPNSICDMESLVELNLRGVQLTELPDYLGNLKRLKILDISYSRITKLPSTIGMVTRLEVLNASQCSDLQGDMSDELGGLLYLKELYFDDTNICSLPARLNGIPSLKKLCLLNCKELESLPELPSSLEYLEVTCMPMKGFTCLQQLLNLKKLWLHNSINFEEIPGDVSKLVKLECLILSWTSVNILPTEFAALCSLKELVIVECQRLHFLPTLPSNLCTLHIQLCESLEELPNLLNMKKLSELSLAGCSSLRKIQELESLQSLKSLDLADCNKLENFDSLEQLAVLKHLGISRCGCLEKLPNLSKLKRLRRLTIRQCKKLADVEGLRNLDCLEILDLLQCESLEKLPDLSKLENLQRLRIMYCARLAEIECSDNFKRLYELVITYCKRLVVIKGLNNLESLKILEVSGCEALRELPDLSSLTNLLRLSICYCKGLGEIKGLDNLESLSMLSLVGCISLERIPDISKLSMLSDFYCIGCEKLNHIPCHKKTLPLSMRSGRHYQWLYHFPLTKNLNNHLAGRCKLLSYLKGNYTKVEFVHKRIV